MTILCTAYVVLNDIFSKIVEGLNAVVRSLDGAIHKKEQKTQQQK